MKGRWRGRRGEKLGEVERVGGGEEERGRGGETSVEGRG